MDWITDYVNFASRISEPAIIFHEWCAVSAIASCLKRKCRLILGSLRFYPNMYIVLVGPSGCRKGTAMRIAVNMVSDIKEVSLSSQSTTREALIRQIKAAVRTETVNGKLTIDSSFTIHSEEFTVFLGYNNLELITNLTDWYDCGTGKTGLWNYETIGRGKDEIQGMWVNMLAATTPQALKASLPMEAVGIGLASRIIFVYASKRSKVMPFPVMTPEDIAEQDDLQRRLESMLLISGDFAVTDDFVSVYSDWYIKHGAKNPFNDPKFSGYSDRRAAHIWKLCMIMNASRGGGKIISVADFERSLDLLTRTEESMDKVFSGFGSRDAVDVMVLLMQDIALYKEMSFETIMRKYYKDADNKTMEGIITSLESMGYIDKVINDKGKIYIRYRDVISNSDK